MDGHEGNGNGNGNGNRDRPSRADGLTPLEVVSARIEARAAEEAQMGAVPALEEAPTSADEDPARRWKRAGSAVTLEVLHEGLIAVSQISEAAIEGGLKMASDLHKALPGIERVAAQVAVTASKVEVASAHVHQVDDSVAELGKTMRAVRKDMQFVKDTVTEMQAPVRQIPAIKEMLGEILARLPEPKVRRRRKTA